MGFELFFLTYAPRTIILAWFLCVVMLCVRNNLRYGNKFHWKKLAGLFLFSVAFIWLLSTLLHEYAYWRVSVYDKNGSQFFISDGSIEPRLHDKLMTIVIYDTGNALQPLGAILNSLVFIAIGQLIAFPVASIRNRIIARRRVPPA